MTASTAAESVDQLLEHYQLPGSPVFMVGIFDKGITVFSQQVRALNLAWALIESGTVGLNAATSRKRIAVVGAGFAGLTVAAGLLKKRANADIILFERRDTVLPLQHGSDTRWLHPHIYDWPSRGSESSSAALPVLHWTASRASDVVVEVLKHWAVVSAAEQPMLGNATSDEPTIRVFCNTRYLRVSDTGGTEPMTVEWIGEERDKSYPAVPFTDRPTPVGESGAFDIVILTVGFGLESGAHTPYWRNETLAQPQLGQARSTYIVSGAGDGAMIDLFRLRISDFRQDRILAELFSGHDELVERLREIRDSTGGDAGLDALRRVWEDASLKTSSTTVEGRLRDRLRQDTTVLLRVRERSFARLFVGKRVSFQNRLLAYLLYRCGAFTPVTAAEDDADLSPLAEHHGVGDDRIVIRHGTETKDGVTDVLADSFRPNVDECFEHPDLYLQHDDPAWTGGYFDISGLTQAEVDHGSGARDAEDTVKNHWRREYLPSPVEAIATAFCSAVSGFVASATQPQARLRVTLHRTVFFGDEVVLQQCCEYPGVPISQGGGKAGRTFPSRNGTIGAAFDLRRVVRTKAGASRNALETDMTAMNLNDASQQMAQEVNSVAAIPLLGPADSGSGRNWNVVGVLYLDSYDEDAFVDDDMLGRVIGMCTAFLASLPAVARTTAGRITNTEFWRRGDPPSDRSDPIDPANWQGLEQAAMDAPRTEHLRYLNFDFSDFTPVEQT